MVANVRGALLDELEFIKHSGKSVAVLLSSGVDSNSVLFACMELGLDVTAYSFTLGDYDSRDFRYAQATAETLEVPFVPVRLNPSEDHLIKYVRYAVRNGCTSKTDFECFWPMMIAMRKIAKDGHGFALSATAADSHFALSKKANMHYKDKVDDYRTVVFKKRNTGQKLLLRAEAARLGITYMTPYDTTRMCSELHGHTWDELNKPKQKQPIRDSFPEYFERIKVTNHTNLQLGDSKIAEHFEILLGTDLNTGGWKSVKGIYNQLVRDNGGEYDGTD
jgi:asparagine synthetase B (glutamine-hydrolysing)